MNFQFALAGIPIEMAEAEALLKATRGDTANPVIDISSLIDSENLDASKLFEMAVSKKQQDLASLAWKISMQQTKPIKATQMAAPTKLRLVEKEESSVDLGEIIDHLNNSRSYATLGVAMLLKATSTKQWVTLRETATFFANELFKQRHVVPPSKFLRGFQVMDGGMSVGPVDMSSGLERRHTFHVSPMYIALREGLLYCKKHDLVEQKRMLSVGAPYAKAPKNNSDSTRRIYYKISATSRGKQMVNLWADLDQYIMKNFEMQAAG